MLVILVSRMFFEIEHAKRINMGEFVHFSHGLGRIEWHSKKNRNLEK